MKNRVIFLFFLLCILKVHSCTIVIGYKNGKVLVGNNEDWYKSNAKYWYEVPKNSEEKYKSFFFGFKGDGKFAQGGMNEVGLMFDGTYVSRIEIDRDNMRRHKLKAAPVHLFKNILKECKTVGEAAKRIDKYFIPYIRTAQVLIVDAAGGYLIVKANGTTDIGHLKEGEFKIITNFHLENLNTKNYTCYRYDIAKGILKTHFENTIVEFEEILSKTSQNYPAATVYSNIYDLKEKSTKLYYNSNFNEKITISFRDSLHEKPKFLEGEIFKMRMIDVLTKTYRKKRLKGVMEKFEMEYSKAKPLYQVDVQQLVDFSEYVFLKNKNLDYEEIISFIQRRFPDNDTSELAVGISLLRKGEIDTALIHFKKALDINPENYWANRLYKDYSGENNCTKWFALQGHKNARSVVLFGNFNEWKGYTNVCKKIDGVWKTCVKSNERVLKYKFKVDGKWVEDPKNPSSEKLSNGFRVSKIVLKK
ncbi:carcinine hydrolase/isopenicillin-N N-acyltransferase family protein [uncultured Psychroserpens sp.]|uniref:carcinine hydrolase/isopenicillin-N N-acyltransferase family protein n=1 Tax=uncultured Psychroserpens sp. TaxID=255436 RepID=UPI0026088F48|nr:carcinine hydrolase/isopenicillin-N N-acyltransferase family protein [uncultured Psychroserpens sp.]